MVSSLSRNHSASQFSPTFIPFLLASCHTFKAHFVIFLLKDMKPWHNPCTIVKQIHPLQKSCKLPKISEGTSNCLWNQSLLVVTILLTSCIHNFSLVLSSHRWDILTTLDFIIRQIVHNYTLAKTPKEFLLSEDNIRGHLGKNQLKLHSA